MPEMKIPFNRPYLTGKEIEFIGEALSTRHLSGDGEFTRRCHAWLEDRAACARALLTHSCTAALEMAALLIDVQPGDEVIMPSYTFVSTANAFVLRGGVPVFVDIRPDTLNLDESLVEAAITPRTRAIVPVHYAGVACEMDAIAAVARRHELYVIEDAAQGVMATYRGRELGSIGHLGALSFHETKNVIAGEGGALLVGDARFVELAEIIREKGTDRSKFFRGEVDKYSWQHLGSSYLPNELTAAFLWGQLTQAEALTARRLAIWERYHALLAPLEEAGMLRRPVVPAECRHNAHMYYVLLPDHATRARLLDELKERGIHAIFHYVPLHGSPAGRKYGRCHGDLPETEAAAERIVRLPLWIEMGEPEIVRVVEATGDILAARARS
jgi:dTDP-4-amino-4,6-dideoxygalactose transaminase